MAKPQPNRAELEEENSGLNVSSSLSHSEEKKKQR